ncbi:MAG: hypothetical protein GY807_21990 [Gammaproteobacteria bacterium]|nr:hypothetical protein [Gammaproteobacteria bacterium]
MLIEYGQRYEIRDEAMARAYYSETYTLKETGGYFGVHAVTVECAVRRLEKR